MRLQDCLEALTASERAALRTRRGIVLDPNKRIDEVEQTARALVAETDLRKSKFPAEVRSLLHRLASSHGVLADGVSDPGAQLLIDLGIAYRVREGGKGSAARSGKRLALGVLVMPSAFLVQVPLAEGDDPRSLRSLLGRAEHEIIALMLQTVVGKPLPVVGPLALQEVWEVLAKTGELEARIQALPSQEARLLDAIERAGSEVTTDELLALDQTPGLYRTASGIAVPKRGAPYMLQRRALLFPVGVDRFVLPTEVSRIVGASRAQERAERRAHLLATLSSDDHAPSRARFSRDPSPVVVAALGMLRAWDIALRDDVAVPRATIRRIAERLGEREESISLLLALSRSCGLSRLTAPSAMVPQSMTRTQVCEIATLIRNAYRRGGSWDESRQVPEALRAAGDSTSSVGSLLRSMLFDALDDSVRDKWVPVDLLIRLVMEDPRTLGARRIHERARRERAGQFRDSLEDSLRVMLVESLPALGLADVSEDGNAVRYRARERSSVALDAEPTLSRSTLEVPSNTPAYALLALSDCAEPEHVRSDNGAVLFNVGVNAITRARARGLSEKQIVERLEALGLSAPFPGALGELATSLGVTHEVDTIALSAAIRVDDDELRASLLADASLRRMIVEVDAGPWLLVKPDVDAARLHARLQRAGVRSNVVVPSKSNSEPPPPMQESIRPAAAGGTRKGG
ncbi:MAG: hypothetical protein U0269_01245 [Polyangiales bacterium]